MKKALFVATGLMATAISIPALLETPNPNSTPRHLTDFPASAEAAIRAKMERLDRDRTAAAEAAAAYAAAKRAPLDPTTDTHLRLREALESLDNRPRYSTAQGGFVLSRAAARSAGVFDKDALGTWESLGPGNIGGRTRALVIDPVNPSILYAAGVSGGIWKSVNGGGSWTPLTDSRPEIDVGVLVMDPHDRTTLYAGTGEGYFRESIRGAVPDIRGPGVLRSEDSGATWQALGSTLNDDFRYVNDLIVSHRNPSILYASTRTGVWRSADRGANWVRTLTSTENGGCFDLAARTDRNTDFLFVTCGTFTGQASVYRNQDAAQTNAWEVVLTEPGMGRTTLAIAPSQQNTIYALATSNVPGPRGLYQQGLLAVFRSNSSGAAGTWSAQIRNSALTEDTLILTNPVFARLSECGFQGESIHFSFAWYTNTLAVDPVDPNRLWAGSVDLWRSSDGGRSWSPASYWWSQGFRPEAWAHADTHVIRFHPGYDGGSNQTLFVGGDGGVFRSRNSRASINDGLAGICDPFTSNVRWESLNNGYGVTQFYHGAPYPNGRTYFGGTQDNGTVRGTDGDGPNRWERILGGDGAYVAVDPVQTNIIYAATQFGGFVRSFDRGETFADATNGITFRPRPTTATSVDFLFIAPMLLDPNDSNRLWVGGHRMWRTTDRAARWRAASAGLPSGEFVSAIGAPRGRAGRIFAGTNDGRILRTDQALTTGGGAQWNSNRPRPGWVTSIEFDPRNPNVAYATYGGYGGRHIYRTRDAGESWVPLDGIGPMSLPDLPVHSLVVDPNLPHRLFVGTDAGVLVSPDDGATWHPEATGFTSAITETLAYDRPTSPNPQLFAFTHGRGAWRVGLEPPEPPDPCAVDDTTLCLNQGRFRVDVNWRKPDGETGVGHGVELTGETGYFWFFRPENVELILKVLDGRPVNGNFWVFFGALSNVEYVVRVTDTETGVSRTFVNPQGNLASRADTAAFTQVAASASSASRAPALATLSPAAPRGSSQTCTPDSQSHCLADGRFRVQLTWTLPDGRTGPGTAEPLSQDTGYFTFLNPENVEVVIKVLDGRALNGHFWVFYGALSNLRYVLRVTDTETGEVREYTNPQGRLASVADTEAFAIPPAGS